MEVKKKVIEEKVKDMFYSVKEGIDNILKENLSECYDELKESKKYDYYLSKVAENALKFRLYVENEFSPVKYDKEVLVESARQSDYLSSRIVATKVAGLIESYIIGRNNKLLEAYINKEQEDIGLEFQKTLFKSSLEILEAFVQEACSRRKKKKK